MLRPQVDDIVIPNHRGRYFLNWVKLRAWQWEEYDAVILLDSDAVVLGDLTHLFKLPTNFAWASQNGHTGYDWNRGGMIMMRPCKVCACLHLYRWIACGLMQGPWRLTTLQQLLC